MARKSARFLRIGYTQYSKLGLRRKKKQKYRRARGGENKMRLKMKGHLRNVSIGFRNKAETRGLVKGLKPKMIYDVEDLKNLGKDEIAIVAKMGNKKRLEICHHAMRHDIRLMNVNARKFIQKIEDEMKKVKDEKKAKEKKKEKKAKEAEKKEEKKNEEATTIKNDEKINESNEIKNEKPTEHHHEHKHEENKQ